MFRARPFSILLAAAAFTAVTASAVSAAPLYSQGFETDTSGWFSPTRVSSGTDGVTSASGSFHAETAKDAGDFTRWGGYNTSTGGSPGAFQPYTTSLDIYLNVSAGAANDTRFDFTNAINDPTGNFLRDFVFNVGFYTSADNTGPGAGTDRFIVSASNNAGRANSFPNNPGRNPISIGTTGWYTFQESFFDNGGALGVTLSILDSADSTIASWLLGGDPIAGVGGNRYGWFANNEFSFLAIDNASLTGTSATPLPAALPLFASGLGAIGLFGWRRKRKNSGAATA
jgi:hypothetical protein